MDNVEPGLPGETTKHIINALYHAFLQREPDAEGLSGYVQALRNGLTVEELFNAFLKSPEFHT